MLALKLLALYFCCFNSTESLLKQTIKRFESLGDCHILTNQKYNQYIKNSSCKSILLETESHDTGYCLTKILSHFKNNEDAFLIVPADHYMKNRLPY